MPELVPISSDRIDVDAAKVVRRLLKFNHEAYLVGGCVRDLLLGRTPKDFDVSTSATPMEIKKLFRNCRIIGRRFRLAHIFFQGNKNIETSTFRSSPHLAPPAAGEELLIRRDNIFGTAEQDAKRRDFTINGLFYDLQHNCVIDYVDGQADLRSRTMRTIGDPRVRFQEDPVRILRAIRFAARLGFTLEPATEQALIEFRGLIAQCAPARVIEEIYRLLSIGHAEAIFRLLHETGVMAVLFPELRALLGRPVNPLASVSVLPLRPGSGRKQPEGDPLAPVVLTTDDALEGEIQNSSEGEIQSASEGEAPGATAGGPPYLERDHWGPEARPPLPPLTHQSPIEEDIDPQEYEERAEHLIKMLLSEDEQHFLNKPEQAPNPGTGQEPGAVGQNRQLAIQQFWVHLTALDQWLAATQTPPSHGLLLSTPLLSLVLPVLSNASRPHQIMLKLDPLLSSITTRLQVSRKDKERLKDILLVQRRLSQHGRRGRPMALVQREYFFDAFQLLQVRSLADENCLDAVSRWQTLLEEAPRPKRRNRHRNARQRNRGPQ